MQIDGMVSGLKTADIIDSLMNVAAIPKNLITAKITDRNTMIGNLQTLNASLQALAAKAKTAASAQSLAAFAATSSADGVTVTAGPTASPFSTSVVVDAVASAHSVVTAAAGVDAWGGTFTLVASDGTKTEVASPGTTAAEFANAVNAAKAGITASVVPGGKDASGNPLFRIQLSSTATGRAAAFTLYRGSAAGVDAGVAPDMATEPGAAILAQGADARIRLFAGTAAEQTLTSASNTFSGIGQGIDVTVSKASIDPVTVSVAYDPKAQSATAESFVKDIASLLTRIDNGSKATVAAAGEKTTLGVFTGDSTVRSLRSALANAVQYPVGGVSPSSVGISIDRYGALSFDSEKFGKAMAADPEGTQAIFTAVAGRVAQTASQYSDTYDGMLTRRITGQESEVKTLKDQVTQWDRRLEDRRAALERTYASLEVQLSGFQSQSSWLTSQLAGLSKSASS
ncbi:flagellar filament capping protein FliD [Microbacterium sp. ASV49]|uniref:Flagellar hook-associated protein 2 n=1 Tax=Microbacterium candidum TaxID=3041922 RepID=A0ABT7MTW4_9MICO|nr:flagellar filament capping protein FliD [Microbacterium sp. ASV49]MDL9977883.1 flagellar filament capping protein FliD [Microbacterium sp. ASV49]